jgi:hypothetical protein
MAGRILDSSVLISFWRQRRAKTKNQSPTEEDARHWAAELIELRRSNLIVSPVAVEFYCGSTNREEIRLYRAFLGEFHVVDSGAIPVADWEDARKRAETATIG